MRRTVAAFGLIASTVAIAPARAADDGFTIALRAGYVLPMGDSAENAKLSDTISGGFPLWADIGYRFNKSFFLGGYFQFALLSVASNTCPAGASCSANDIRFGLEFLYKFIPDSVFAPWVGIGAGYEIGHFSLEQGGTTVSTTWKGFEFCNLQAGGDYRLSPTIAIGPYAAFSLAQYSSASVDQTGQPSVSGDIPNKAIHEWLQFGLKGTFDL